MSFTPDLTSTNDVLAAVLSSELAPLPAQEQAVGASTISWWETQPGEVYIHAEGGTPDDRHYGSTLVSLQLAPHGFRRAQYDIDDMGAPDADPSPGATPGYSLQQGHPLNDLAQRHPNVELSATEDSNGIGLRMLRVEKANQGQGYAGAALKDLLSYADSKGHPVALTPQRPDRNPGMTDRQLKIWYAEHGFVPNKGRNKNWAFRDTMIRPPQT